MLLAALALSMSVPAVMASSPGVTVRSGHATYFGATHIKIYGVVNPHTTTGQVKVTIKNGLGVTIAAQTVPIMKGGGFTSAFAAGGAPWSKSGTYSVTANVIGTTISGTTAFTYTA